MEGGVPLLDSTLSHGQGFTHPGREPHSHTPGQGPHPGCKNMPEFPQTAGPQAIFHPLSLTQWHPTPAHLNEGTRGHTYP